MPTNVFVSYSHADAPLVAPVVRLLRANRSLVFHDADSIRPGRRWRGEIAQGLAEAGLVVLFWCDHASRSEEVAREWRAALDQGKDLLPLLLDTTPLPPELSEFQWIDFRATVGPGHGVGDPTQVPAPRSMRWWPVAGVAAVFVGAAALSLLFLNTLHTPAPDTWSGGVQKSGLPRGYGALAAVLAVLGAIAGLAAFLLWRRRIRRAKAEALPGPAVATVERRIAGELEAELLRRAAAPPRRD